MKCDGEILGQVAYAASLITAIDYLKIERSFVMPTLNPLLLKACGLQLLRGELG